MNLGLRLAITVVITLMISFSQTQAQSRIQVLNEQLQPLVGVNVQDVETNIVLNTNDQGSLLLQLSSAATYRVSHIGFYDQLVTLRPNENKTIVLTARVGQLNTVEVNGFLNNTQISRQAGSISILKPIEFDRFNRISLVNAVNTLPGIRFEERASGSYRISIRGSSIRSPFGVRNVKVYWNGIPFTEPGGNTFINLLDLANVGGVEVIKGPVGSLYGAGTGGVLKIASTNLSNLANKVALRSTFGSYGLSKLSAQYNSLTDKSSFTLKLASHQSDGYRDHNELDRKTFELDYVSFPESKRTFSANLLYSDLFYEIPGGINPEQLAENRKQARSGSESQNSSVSNELFLIRLGQEYTFSTSFSNETNVYGSFNQFTNPFILDFKRDNQQIFGGRSTFDWNLNEVRITAGVEHQNSFFDGKNFGNVAGESDTIRFADEVRTKATNLFSQVNWEIVPGLDVNTGLSINSLSYNINREIDEFTGVPAQFNKNFETVVSPRLGISKQLGENLSAHFSISRGFSPPTTTEIRTNEGTLSLDLEPEKGTNYELNLRGAFAGGKLSYDISAFHFRLKQTIVSNPNMDGVVLFENAGETNQNGLEIQLKADLIDGATGLINELNSSISFTYHEFLFRDYVKRGNLFTGNALPGTAPSTFNWRVDATLFAALNLNLTYHYVDPIPLNDANTFSSQAYHLVNLRLGYSIAQPKSVLDFFFGIDNLTNAKYSLGNDLNAFGRRYFQPAPEVNYYFGVNYKFDYRK